MVFRTAEQAAEPASRLWGVQPPEVLSAAVAESARARLTAISGLWWRDQLSQIRAQGLLAMVLCDVLATAAPLDDHATTDTADDAVDARVVTAERLVRARLDHWTVDDMAAAVDMKRNAFTQLFKAARGITPGAWLDQARLSFATVRLASGDATLAHIAACTGHPRPQSFGRWFKARTGMSPGAYRAAHR